MPYIRLYSKTLSLREKRLIARQPPRTLAENGNIIECRRASIGRAISAIGVAASSPTVK